MKFRVLCICFFFIINNYLSFGVPTKELDLLLSDSLTLIANQMASVGRINVQKIDVNTKDKAITIFTNENLAQIPFRIQVVESIYNMLGRNLNSHYPDFSISCISDKQKIETLIPNYYRNNNIDYNRIYHSKTSKQPPLVTNISNPLIISKGLQGRHIALWNSHGIYYNQKKSKWLWQRSRLLQTVEDLYTTSFVLPFLAPMLENAGANVLLPRERDTQNHEIIIDNDIKTTFGKCVVQGNKKDWKTDNPGFANKKPYYLFGENPFTMGTYKWIQSTNDEEESSFIEWLPNIPEEGYYAVYVSYKSLPNSAKDAHYTIHHGGGRTHFLVNQRMAGGTWVYLGNFRFPKGENRQIKITLNNISNDENSIVTADAVKIGGGIGNIARCPKQKSASTSPLTKDSICVKNLSVSTYPRYAEAARYWLQWAGIPDSIYSLSDNEDDYTDDIRARGHWVNYLVGGSSQAPKRNGLKIPVDLAFAFHTDAGRTKDDSIVGTLGINYLIGTDSKTTFSNGVSRLASRDLTDIIQTQITTDLRKTIAPEWTRRGIWNKNYSEARVPDIPSMILELLSHQNFADMRYGHDPRFKFIVSRSIYKGIVKYLANEANQEYIIQPLPISGFRSRFIDKNKVELSWEAQKDSLEPTAFPTGYVVYTRIEDGGFNNGIKTTNNKIIFQITPGKIYSFKVCASNEGGISFPSEILSAYRDNHENKEILIVNGFDRISGPDNSISEDKKKAGFYYDSNPGVPYLTDVSYVGQQYEFDTSKPWISDNIQGFGASNATFEKTVIAGNSFDYPFIHGKAIKSCGLSFCSTSLQAVLDNKINMNQYQYVDLIMGKQKQSKLGKSGNNTDFKTFPLDLQSKIRSYCLSGGNILVSGSYLGSDFYTRKYIRPDEKFFMEKTLKYRTNPDISNYSARIQMVNSPFPQFNRSSFKVYDTPNSTSYFNESTDIIEPAGDGAVTICRYLGNNQSAGIAFLGQYKCCILGFPLESIDAEKERTRLMEAVLSFFRSRR